MRVKRGAARLTPSVCDTLIGRGAATKSSPAYLDFQPNSLNLGGQEIKSAGKAMSNGKPELWEQSRRTVAFDAHTRKRVGMAVLTSQNDDLGVAYTKCIRLKMCLIHVRCWDRPACYSEGESLICIA